MKAVIIAAGKAERLRPLTSTKPKQLIPIGGRPQLEWLIKGVAEAGIKDILIVTHYMEEKIKHQFNYGSDLGVKLSYTRQKEMRGTADAFRYAEDFTADEDFIGMNGDLYLSPGIFKEIVKDHKEGELTVAGLERDPYLYGALNLQGDRVQGIIEKPAPDQVFSNIASLPIYLFEQRIFSHLSRLKPSKRGELELQDAIQMLIDSYGKVRGELVSSRMNLTSAQDLLEINLYFLQKEAPQKIQDPVQIGRNVTLIPPYFLGANTIIGDQCVIGPQVYVESNAHIGQGCSISNTILLQGSRLDLPQVIKNTIIFPEQSTHQNQGSTQ